MATSGLIDALFREHPRSIGESYGGHCAGAWSFGWRMFIGACAAFIHGVVPGLCKTTASGIVRELHQRLERGTRVG